MKTIAIRMPKLGESVAEATITKWLVKQGDWVQRDDILCEIATDKVETELPSEFEGKVVNILIDEGEEVAVGAELLTIETDDAPEQTKQNSTQQHAEDENEKSTVSKDNHQQMETRTSQFGFLSPVVRAMVAKHDISEKELAQIEGTGHQGRVTKKDMEQFLQKQRSSLSKPKQLEVTIEPGDQRKPLSKVRKTLAENLLQSSQWIPHVTTFKELDVLPVMEARKQWRTEFKETHGIKLTPTHCLMYASIQALNEFPALNSWLIEDEWIWKQHINLAIAVATDTNQLIVPNLKSVEALSFKKFVLQLSQTISKAKNKQLSPLELRDATFTITNTGVFGSSMGTPIISIPQVAVLALGEISRKPVVRWVNDEEVIRISSVMNASLSYDHRVVDGKLASEFLTNLQHQINQFKEESIK